MPHRASAYCTIRPLPKPTFCREPCRPRSSSSSSRRRAGTGIFTSFPPSKHACGICARCRPRRRKPPGQTENAPRVSRSVAGNGVFARRVEIGFVQEIEGFLGFGKQLLVAVAATARSLEQRFHSRRLGDRRTTGLEIVHERPDSRERLVVVQTELREQLLECHLVPAVGEGRAVETESDRSRRALLSLFHPHQARLRVDETTDEPSGGEPIGQEGFAGGPSALEVIAPRLGKAAGVGGIRKHSFSHLAFRVAQRLRGPLLCRRTKEIERADRFEFTSLLAENSSDRTRLGNSEARA